MFSISLIVTPIAGAIIGYITNDLAIKMLFHPYEAKYIFGHKIPFTPGLIPKEKDRMAASISQMISEKLMTEDILRDNLLSDEVLQKINNAIAEYCTKLQQDSQTIGDKITTFFEQEEVELFESKITESLSNIVNNKLTNANLGTKLADQAIEHFKKNAGFIEQVGIAALGSTLNEKIAATIDNIITTQAKPLSKEIIHNGMNDILAKPVNSLLDGNEEQVENIKSAVLKFYKNTINEQLPRIMDTINLQQMVENKIKEMEVKEMEDLIFGIMDKELKSIVYLGALLGFFMGFVTLALNQIIP